MVPGWVTPELAELVGYFMGDGSLRAKSIRLCVANTDADVVERLGILAKELFGLSPVVSSEEGYQQVTLQSVRLARWWQAAGFAKQLPRPDHVGKGLENPWIPSAILEANDPAVYSAFLRGLFEADGTVLEGVPSVSTADDSFAAEVRTLLLVTGLATTTRRTVSGWGGTSFTRSGSATLITRWNSASGSGLSANVSRGCWRSRNQIGPRRRTTCSSREQVWMELVPPDALGTQRDYAISSQARRGPQYARPA